MGSSEPLPIAESDKGRKKKKRKARATDSLPGRFEGWSHTSLRSGPVAAQAWEEHPGSPWVSITGCIIFEPAHDYLCDRDER